MKTKGSKKNIAIFGYKQRLMSMDMKTKLVQHVESDWMRDWKGVRVRECVRVRAWECESVRVTFEHRDENKSCSACRQWVNERLKECESEREWVCEKVTFEHRHENKSCSACQKSAFVWHSDIFGIGVYLFSYKWSLSFFSFFFFSFFSSQLAS